MHRVHWGMEQGNPAKGTDGEALEPLIFAIRGDRVMLDTDLARLYGVKTKALNQAVKRNQGRFPQDFAFQLTTDEVTGLRLKIAVSTSNLSDLKPNFLNRSQIVTGFQKHRDPGSRPWAFTEHGALMAANDMEDTRVSSKGKIIIPKRVREALGLKPGSELTVELLPGDGFVARVKASDRVTQLRKLAGMLAHRGKRISAARESAAIMSLVAAEDARATRARR